MVPNELSKEQIYQRKRISKGSQKLQCMQCFHDYTVPVEWYFLPEE